MSQEKVDRYKQEKANRKKTIAKEKLKKKLYIVAGAVVGIAFLGWIAWSIPAENRAAEEARQQSIDDSIAMSKLLEELQAQLATQTTTTGSATTGTGDTTTAGDATTGTGDETTSADESTTSENTTEEETTTSAKN